MFRRTLHPILLFCLNLLFVVPLYAQDDVSLPADRATADRAVITPENVAQLQRLGRYGTGELSDAFAWTPDGQTLAIGGATGIWLYVSDSLNILSDFIPTERYVDRVGFSPDGRYLAYRTRGFVVHLLDYATHTEIQTFANAQAFTFHPVMPLFVVGTDQHEMVEEAGERNVSRIMLWDITQRQSIKTFELAMHMWGSNNIVNLDFSADGTLFAAAWQSGIYSSCGDRASEVFWWNFDDILNHTEAELNHYENTFKKTLPDQYGVKFHPTKNTFASVLIEDFLPPISDILVLHDPFTNDQTEYDFDPTESTGSPHKSVAAFAFDAAGDQIHVLIESNTGADAAIYTLNLSDESISQDARFSGQITGYAPLPFPTAAMRGQYRIAHDSGDLVSIGATQAWIPNEVNDDGSAFLTRDFDGVRRLWAFGDAGEVEEIPLPPAYQGWTPNFIPGGQMVKFDAEWDEHRFALWDFSARTTYEFDASDLLGDWRNVDFSANGQRMALQRTNGRIEIYDTSSGTQLAVLDFEFDDLVELAFRPDVTHLTTAHFVDTGSTIEVREWVTDTGALHRDYGGYLNSADQNIHKAGLFDLQYSTDGAQLGLELVYTLGGEQKQNYLSIHVFDVTSGEILFTHQEEAPEFQRGMFTDDLHYYAQMKHHEGTSAYVVLIDLWQSNGLSDDDDMAAINSFYSVVPNRFSPNDTRLLLSTGSATGCGSDNRALLLHDVKTLALVSTIRLPRRMMGQGGSEHYGFSPDSSMLMISTDAGTQVFEAQSGALITTIDGLDNSQLRFNADGTLLIAARDDGTVTLWGIPTDSAD